MKALLPFIIICLMLSCTAAEKESTKQSNKQVEKSASQEDNFNWLLGNWKRLNETAGKETFETWKKISASEYFGLGYTLQNGDTIFQEHMQLLKTDKSWDLTVKQPQESTSVTFKGTSHTDNAFTCENKKHDFPTKIKYWKNEANINASVSNAEMEIAFEFERMK